MINLSYYEHLGPYFEMIKTILQVLKGDIASHAVLCLAMASDNWLIGAALVEIIQHGRNYYQVQMITTYTNTLA